MANKVFIGLSYEGVRLRIARLQVHKNRLELMQVDTIDLPQPIAPERSTGIDELNYTEEREAKKDDFIEGEKERETTQDTFSLDDENKELNAFDDLDENYDMTQVSDDAVLSSENEHLLAEFLARNGDKKLNIGLHIPFGKTAFHFLKNVDPGSMKKKERLEFFNDKLSPGHDGEISPDDYAWIPSGENSSLLAYSFNEKSLISLVEVANTFYDGKLRIKERMPDESIWAGLARVNYELGDDEITGLIAIGEKNSRILFMKGEQIINVLPIITEGEKSDRVLNTIFSKILFEIDKGELPKLNRLLIVKSSRLSEKALTFFNGQFEDVEVEFLSTHPEKLTYADELLNSPVNLQPYLSAIGAAWAASKVNEKEFSQFSLLPHYVREKQRVLKIEWHGIAMLLLIALTPLYLNNLYYEKAGELNSLNQEISQLETQIAELRPIASMAEGLTRDYGVIQAENNRLLELARYSQQWSQTLDILNNGIDDISGLWLTTFRSLGDSNISVSGVSLTRSQIPVLSTLFTDSNIQDVAERNIREQPVYFFSMQTHNIRQDLSEFLLEMPETGYDSEQAEEIELDFSGLPTQPEQELIAEALNSEVLPESQTNSGSGNSEQQEEQASANTIQSEESLPVDDVTLQENSNTQRAYTIVLHSIRDSIRAELEKTVLAEEGFTPTLSSARLANGEITWRIGVGEYETVRTAEEASAELPEPYRSNHFIIRIR